MQPMPIPGPTRVSANSRHEGRTPSCAWRDSTTGLDWHALSALYEAAGMGRKAPEHLVTAFGNSRYVRFAFDADKLVAAGRVLADGVDCAYLCDVAVAPSHQGAGLGQAMLRQLLEAARGHRKIILYAVAGREGFYERFGFRRMTTAMAIFEDEAGAAARGLLALGRAED